MLERIFMCIFLSAFALDYTEIIFRLKNSNEMPEPKPGTFEFTFILHPWSHESP